MPIGNDRNRKKARKRTADKAKKAAQQKAARQGIKGRALDRHKNDQVTHDARAAEKKVLQGTTFDHRHSVILRHQQAAKVKPQKTLMSGGARQSFAERIATKAPRCTAIA